MRPAGNPRNLSQERKPGRIVQREAATTFGHMTPRGQFCARPVHPGEPLDAGIYRLSANQRGRALKCPPPNRGNATAEICLTPNRGEPQTIKLGAKEEKKE